MSEPESKSVERLDARGTALDPEGPQGIGAHGPRTADGQGGFVPFRPAIAPPLRAAAPGPRAPVPESAGVGHATLGPAAPTEAVSRFPPAP
jgi:hypothetical protein